MQIPMETLSQMTTRTDSGTGIAASRSNQARPDKNFEKIFGDNLDKNNRKMQKDKKIPAGNENSSKSVKKADSVKNDNHKNRGEKIKNNDKALAAGEENPVKMQESLAEQGAGIQEEVVFILEGEESVTTSQMRTDSGAGQPEFNPNAGQTEDLQGKTINTETVQVEKNADDSETAQFKDVLAAKSDAATQANKDAAVEVTARTPEVVPEAKQTNENSDTNHKDNGNPSLLENENEGTLVKGQEEKDDSYAKAAEAAIKAAGEETAKPTETTPVLETAPPISEGIKPAQLIGAEQMTKAAVEHAVKPENLFQEMINKVQTVQDGAKQTMTIQLNPEFLGKVALEVGVDASGVHVKINAEDSNVRGMISSQLSTLIESLESKGIAVSEVEVVYAGANFDNLSEQSDGRQGNAGNGNAGKHGANAKDNIEYYTTLTDLMDYYLDAGISSVEYRA